MIRFRPAAQEDLPEIARLYKEAFPGALDLFFGGGGPPLGVIVDFMRGMHREEAEGFWVAQAEGQLAGFAIVSQRSNHLLTRLLLKGTVAGLLCKWMIGRYRGMRAVFVPRLWRQWREYRRLERSHPRAKSSGAQVLSIVVAPWAQRQGIGRSLANLSLDVLRRASVRSVRLEVDAANEAAIQLYREFGFKEVGRLQTPRGPALVMIAELDSIQTDKSPPR